MFRMLIVDDNCGDVQIVKSLAQTFEHPPEVFVCTDGFNAIEFLHCREPYQAAPRPDLILLDINMPGMDGLDVLAEIKTDPALAVIAVIILSSSSSPDDIQRAYRAHANCYVKKPTDMNSAERLMRAIESFWMDVAVPPPFDEERPYNARLRA